MRFRTGLIVGLATGYVLGARAGRKPLGHVTDLVERVSGNGDLSAAVGQTASVTERPRAWTRSALSSGLRATSESIRARSTPRRHSS